MEEDKLKPLLEAPNVGRLVKEYLQTAYKGQKISVEQAENRAIAFIAGLARATDITMRIGMNKDSEKAADVIIEWQDKLGASINDLIEKRRERRNKIKEVMDEAIEKSNVINIEDQLTEN